MPEPHEPPASFDAPLLMGYIALNFDEWVKSVFSSDYSSKRIVAEA